ncbi:hypothetical protein C8Q74DRAFT_759871 [Fomes fomentarius]|nr:hypothetical protein C8Q74DRAFT_759871 [Fomes fomentarius]
MWRTCGRSKQSSPSRLSHSGIILIRSRVNPLRRRTFYQVETYYVPRRRLNASHSGMMHLPPLIRDPAALPTSDFPPSTIYLNPAHGRRLRLRLPERDGCDRRAKHALHRIADRPRLATHLASPLSAIDTHPRPVLRTWHLLPAACTLQEAGRARPTAVRTTQCASRLAPVRIQYSVLGTQYSSISTSDAAACTPALRPFPASTRALSLLSSLAHPSSLLSSLFLYLPVLPHSPAATLAPRPFGSSLSHYPGKSAPTVGSASNRGRM